MPRLGRANSNMRPHFARGVERRVLPILRRLVLSKRHQRISQTQGAHVMRLRGLHDLDKRLVESAAPHRDEHTFRSVEDPRPRPARILRPTRCVQLALTSCVHPSAITPYNLWQNAYISLLMVLGVGLRQRDEPGNAPPLRGHRILVITRQVDRDRTLAR